MSAIDKVRRQSELITVLREEVIHNQEDLRRALRRRGFRVTQATLSRDLKELRVPCVPTASGYRYALPEMDAMPVPAAPARMQNVAAVEVTGIDANEMAIIIRTLNGRAQGVAVWLDGQQLNDMLATIAGDDTILVLPRSVKSTARLKQDLAALLQLD